MTFGEKIKIARINKNMSQDDFAKAIGVSKRTVSNYESYGMYPKRCAMIPKIAEVLGVDPEFLLDDTADFILSAGERYGSKAKREAKELVSDFKALAAGGELPEEDIDEVMRAIQDAYWDAKALNRKYVPKKYRTTADEEAINNPPKN